ncbi:60S acidic ribosomal protein P1 [Homalodisca vitripennis]|nr:60S acidic ribosomal protein P1 [Homalodisca vitripennis]
MADPIKQLPEKGHIHLYALCPALSTIKGTQQYRAFILGEKIQTILKAAGVEVEPYWPGLFAKALEGINPKELITNVGAGVGAGVPASAGGAAPAPTDTAAAPAAEKKEEKKKEESENESDDDMGFALESVIELGGLPVKRQKLVNAVKCI